MSHTRQRTARVVFRLLAAPASLPGRAARRAAAELVRAHDPDTLSFFKLRVDRHYFSAPDRSAFVGCRVRERGAAAVRRSRRPVEVVPALLADLRKFVDARGSDCLGRALAAMWAEGQLWKPERPRPAWSPGRRVMARAR
ncbi:MAG: hypothetical protein ACJ780_12135 [Solirubrobacteraceae bacterium]